MSSAPDTMSSGGHAPTIDYSVPLPSQNSGNRIVRLDLDLDPQQDFLPSALAAGQTYAEAAGVSITGSNASVDPEKTIHFLRRRMLAIGFDAESVERSLTLVPDLLSSRRESARLFRRTDTEVSPAEPGSGEVIDGVVVDPILGNPLDLVKQFTAAAQQGTVLVPTVDGSGKGVVTEAPETPDPAPALFLVEKYDVSSFLGDYGMGRTIRTFTLLPGESTTIRLKTWQSSKESIKQSSSIIDSSEQSAKERFANKMQDETTDKRTRSDSQSWAVEAEASASWGFGSASVKASAEGEYHSGREQFARSATEAVSEHARDSSSKRQLSVTSSAETETETGEETSIERAISNVNMRRVLNFVFRELNQTYTTKLHLTNIWVAFTNGRENTWRQVPVAGLRGLLTEFLRPEKVDETAQRILKVAGLVFDADDVPVRVLEVVLYDASTDTVAIEPVTLN
ncbi:MAG: hypothetical protein ACRDP4_13655, partial [Nocardioidaceae bacterium]